MKEVILPAVGFQASDGDCTVRVDYKWGDQMRFSSPVPPASP